MLCLVIPYTCTSFLATFTVEAVTVDVYPFYLVRLMTEYKASDVHISSFVFPLNSSTS